ncbi:MAG TPA: hypothetical protein VG754_09885 [Verrucomicrobiae bacterium]|jgi:hypothetical protein|nr:hypothetical protein [Verrucomicrobiae bacterium]
METNWAAEHLQTIRTLMERSALYRRALAPISTFVGVVGIAGAILGWGLDIAVASEFTVLWMLVGIIAVSGALVLVRKQALKQGEAFWSPPMRRIVQAMVPALLIGFILGLPILIAEDAKLRAGTPQSPTALILTFIWTCLYGLALNAAGFFMPRGIRLFSWLFIIGGIGLIFMKDFGPWDLESNPTKSANVLMGLVFGASHLAYGIYLYFTERKNEA